VSTQSVHNYVVYTTVVYTTASLLAAEGIHRDERSSDPLSLYPDALRHGSDRRLDTFRGPCPLLQQKRPDGGTGMHAHASMRGDRLEGGGLASPIAPREAKRPAGSQVRTPDQKIWGTPESCDGRSGWARPIAVRAPGSCAGEHRLIRVTRLSPLVSLVIKGEIEKARGLRLITFIRRWRVH
jgi:hypothetical protein